MSDVSIWHDLENDRDYVSGHGRRVEVDPIVTEAYLSEFATYDSALKLENKNLRELITDYDKMLSLIMSERDCKDDCMRVLDDAVQTSLRIRAAELGIEVE